MLNQNPEQLVHDEINCQLMALIWINQTKNKGEGNKDSNSHRTKVEIESDKDSHLEINPESKLINSLVDYSDEGGGNIAARIESLLKRSLRLNPRRNPQRTIIC